MGALTLHIGGCRGSMAVAGERYRRYGGNTTCFFAEVEPGHHLVIDCGTGLRALQRLVADREGQRYTVFLTHYHWDHIQGVPVFMPLFERGNAVSIHGPRFEGLGVREILGRAFAPPLWPVSFADMSARVSFHDLGEAVSVGPVRISHTTGSHPQGVVSYRLDGPTRSVVIATDHEAGKGEIDGRIVGLATGADVLLHDAQYTPEEVKGVCRGWGHSSYESAVRAAGEAGVSHLILTSHDPSRTDEDVDRLRAAARAGFPHTDAAHEGMKLSL